MRYRLRTLVLATILGPPMLAGVWWTLRWLGAKGVITVVGISVGVLFAAVAALVRWKAARQTVSRDEIHP